MAGLDLNDWDGTATLALAASKLISRLTKEACDRAAVLRICLVTETMQRFEVGK